MTIGGETARTQTDAGEHKPTHGLSLIYYLRVSLVIYLVLVINRESALSNGVSIR